MKITKILNNNVVISKINNEERIVIGKGIAFGKQNGQELEKDKIDKVFRLTSEEKEPEKVTLLKIHYYTKSTDSILKNMIYQ
ncbi:CAT RNA binding domain-containing protein [Staphylococcus saprophyticus]|uniref:CAT RNA binding domain-containing protein n=1 Tax=Staphylococcus saprophyticus TaxID=29385 RepID=UPI001F131EB3|nr:CAT RNA binding domain-containing protein [Staphylococcus saprophyticus]